MVDKNKIINNQKGQALFELIIFLPFLIFLYMIYSTAGDSISGSINQQKAVRGYFYSLVRGNSYLNSLPDLVEYEQKGIRMVGFSALGWREKGDQGNAKSFSPCFKFSSLMKNNSSEECDSSERGQDNSGHGVSHYVRVFTFYGVCGPVYSESKVDGQSFFHINPSAQTDPRKCALSDSPIE